MSEKQKRTKRVCAKITEDQLQLLDSVVANLGMDRSTFLRVAMLKELARMHKLPPDQIEDLGIMS